MKTTKLFLIPLVLMLWFSPTLFGQSIDKKIITNYLTQIETFQNSKRLTDQLPVLFKGNTKSTVINLEHFVLGGGIVQTLIEQWESNQWENFNRITYTFDYEERMAGFLVEQWESDHWENFMKDSITYNDDAYPDVTIIQYWNAGTTAWDNFHLDSLSYDSNHNVIKTVGKTWVDTGWVNQTKNLLTYDDNNNLIETIMMMWQENGWVNINKQVTTYNEKNLKTEWLSKFWMDTEWVDQMRTTYNYDMSDLLTDELTRINMFVEWKTSQIKKYEYNSNGQEIVKYTKEIDPMSGDTTSNTKVSSSYSDDLLTEELTQDWANTEWVNSDLETYTYEDNQLTVELWQVWKNNSWENKERWTHTYGTVDVKNGNNLVYNFSLEQNYPNPFNPSTTISFTIDKREHVELAVYNSIGQLVTKLINEEKSAGDYQVTFNASNLPSGIYYYQLLAGNRVLTKKCILLK